MIISKDSIHPSIGDDSFPVRILYLCHNNSYRWSVEEADSSRERPRERQANFGRETIFVDHNASGPVELR